MLEDAVVIDVDSHWEPPRKSDLAGGDPMERVHNLVAVLAEDVLRNLPREEWPPLDSLAGEDLIEFFGNPKTSPMSEGLGAADVAGRLQWCNQVGIDFQFVNGGGFTGLELGLQDPKERRTAIRSANDLLLDDLDGHTDRFSAIAICDPTDLDVAISELERCREQGSRAYHLRAQPPDGISYAHPHFDRLWSATVDLGMIAYLHIGNTPAHFDAGWANMGLDHPDSAGRAGLMRLSNSARTQAAETMLAAMAYGGVFARHPKLTILAAELWAGWLPFLLMRLDQNTAPHRKPQTDLLLGEWPYERSAGDYLRRNVRVSPLPGLGRDGIPTLLQEPGMIAFSSDYPHIEGSATPIDEYQPELDELDAELRTSFLGGTIADVFERMGDPLPVKKTTAA